MVLLPMGAAAIVGPSGSSRKTRRDQVAAGPRTHCTISGFARFLAFRPAVAGPDGRWRVQTGSVARWRSGFSPAGSRCWTCQRGLAARARVFDTGQGRKTDATDAHAVVIVAVRDQGLGELSVDRFCHCPTPVSHTRSPTSTG